MRNRNRVLLFAAVLFFCFPNQNFSQVGKADFQQQSFSIIQAILDSVNIDSIYQTERHLTGEEPFWLNNQIDSILTRHSYQPGIFKAQDYLQSRFEKMGYAVELAPFQLGGSTLNNIVATKTGTVHPLRFYILCAHYDSTSPLKATKAPGADDNGSGTSAVLEAARVLANHSFEYSIKFILFPGEEQGLNGSEAYALNAYQNSELIEGVINVDMIGYDGNEDNVFEIHTGFLNESQTIGDFVANNVVNWQLSLVPEMYSGTYSTTRSDHSSFWTWNYPAILIIEDFFGSPDRYPFYHTANDLLSKLRPDFFLDMARLSIGSLASLAGIDSITSDIPITQITPNDYKLYPPYPNPFNPSVNIEYEVSSLEDVSVKIYDSLGRIVTTLFEGKQPPGNHFLTWNGLQNAGDLAASGIYFVIFQAGDFFEKQKIILMR